MKKDEVIKYLKRGKKIYCKLVKHYGATFNVVYQATIYRIHWKRGYHSRIHHSTIKSLQKSGIIDSKYNFLNPKTKEHGKEDI